MCTLAGAFPFCMLGAVGHIKSIYQDGVSKRSDPWTGEGEVAITAM